ncbi:MAG: hypothetical protein IPG63_18465 [Xanthomonadales bacterium]|nr:hypothetical protein [Xanthomonadales bacterium]MBK7145439.1 hypothetical protein [Xanthomonadales bacterium]
MSTIAIGDRIIATDYFDGPSEGFARIAGTCFYFRRQSDDGSEDVSNYTYSGMEDDLFAEVERAVGAISSASSVFVYSGSDDAANRIVDEALVSLRARAEHEDRSASGHDFFEAMQSK